jgi:hypothetical protein
VKDEMRIRDDPPKVALKCAQCDKEVLTGQEHQCEKEKKNEKTT